MVVESNINNTNNTDNTDNTDNSVDERIKTVVITGSTRGLGFEMAKVFRMVGWNVVINGVNPDRLQKAVSQLRSQKGEGAVEGYVGNVIYEKDIKGIIDLAVEHFKIIDIWINNAGVNQPMKPVWELTEKDIDTLLDVDLKGAILGTRSATLQMEKQPEGGYIYNVEGFGSNEAMFCGLSIYGTAKRAITYFTQAYAKELDEKKSKVKIGRLSPGIIFTEFTVKPLGGDQEMELSDKTKNIYNILGDYPDVIADFLVKNMLTTTTNNVQISWLSKGR
eukprot:jgi/Orpsp1_1/1175004/evm.model.c7180000052287.1